MPRAVTPIDFTIFDTPRPRIEPAGAEAVAADIYGIDGTATPLDGERDRSFRLDTDEGPFVIKFGNAGDRADALEGQSAAIAWALESDPSLPLARVVPTTDGLIVGHHEGSVVQLTKYIDGAPPVDEDRPPGFRRNVGALAARLDLALRGYDHPVLHRSFPWNLTQLCDLKGLLEMVPADRRRLIQRAMSQFEEGTAPALERLPRQAIHGDLHNDNLVVDRQDPETVVGLFDFGDMTWAPRVVELGIAAAYQCSGADPLSAMIQMAAAYQAISPLESSELVLVPRVAAARCAQSLLISARQLLTDPDNADYTTGDVDSLTSTLTWFADHDPDELGERVAEACGAVRQDPNATESAIELRDRSMASSYRLSYRTPVHLKSGEGVWLIDVEGNRLLDAYNNVPHVGHGHAQVVAAQRAQIGRLSTNTRYLVDGVAEYADRLADLLPDPLSVVMFVNSGSEANDLAYRIARTVSGNRGVITTANAYHGFTAATSAMSPEEYPIGELEPWAARFEIVEVIADPSLLRTRLTGSASVLGDRGVNPGMVIFDTVFSSDGIYDCPPELVDTAAAWAHEQGALLVADEVQAGFGRVGHRFWGFAGGAAVPDIVTMGKPMGNGYPMGAVVTTREIADRFASLSYFFSTFAGSPVAAAVGKAVLDVLEREDLPARADVVGAYLREGIQGLGSPLVTDVRGPGLFIGVEMVDGVTAGLVMDEMRDRGVLVGSTGRGLRTLKVRPPLVFGVHHADMVIDTLGSVLAGLV